MSQFTFGIDDTSPLLQYEPYGAFWPSVEVRLHMNVVVPPSTANGASNQTNDGWVLWYSEAGFNSQEGEDGVGESAHITSKVGASVSLEFFGGPRNFLFPRGHFD